MLLMLIAVPVIVLVAFAHSMLQTYAPSNVLVRRVRTSRPTLRLAFALGLLAFGCAMTVQAVHLAIEAGAPDWLHLVVLVLGWDAIKFAVMACLTSVRRVASALGGFVASTGRPVYASLAALGGRVASRTRARARENSSHAARRLPDVRRARVGFQRGTAPTRRNLGAFTTLMA